MKITTLAQLKSWIPVEIVRLQNLRKNAIRLQDTDMLTGRIQALKDLEVAIE